ncbi:MAG: hypothetical protein KGH69_00895 [Candidatus Micrarchaeota archaeon]|nr:hypothetical protein [Candidatus Micrarchaeota archaeon]
MIHVTKVPVSVSLAEYELPKVISPILFSTFALLLSVEMGIFSLLEMVYSSGVIEDCPFAVSERIRSWFLVIILDRIKPSRARCTPLIWEALTLVFPYCVGQASP